MNQFGAALGQLENPLKNRALEMDDSSSVTSASSLTVKMNSCHLKTCSLRVESLPMKPLVTCGRCSHRWHPVCHDPPINDMYWNTNNWKCTRCAKKTNANLIPALSSNVSKAPSKIGPRCGVCDQPLAYRQPGAKELCWKHEVEDRHKTAQAAKARSASQIPAPARDIQKTKLHPFTPNSYYSKKDMRADKRKRRESNGKSASHSDRESTIFLPRVPTFNQASARDSVSTPGFFTSRPLEARMKTPESPVSNTTGRGSVIHVEKFVVVSPEYEPPPRANADIIPDYLEPEFSRPQGVYDSIGIPDSFIGDRYSPCLMQAEPVQESRKSESLDDVGSPILADIFVREHSPIQGPITVSPIPDLTMKQKAHGITTITGNSPEEMSEPRPSVVRADDTFQNQGPAASIEPLTAAASGNLVAIDHPNRPKCPVCRNGNQRCLGGYPCTRCLQYKRDTREKCLDENYKKRRSSMKNRSHEISLADSEDYMDIDVDSDMEMAGNNPPSQPALGLVSLTPKLVGFIRKPSPSIKFDGTSIQVPKCTKSIPHEIEATPQIMAQSAEFRVNAPDSNPATTANQPGIERAAVYEHFRQLFANIEGAPPLSSDDPFLQEINDLLDKRFEARLSGLRLADSLQPQLEPAVAELQESTTPHLASHPINSTSEPEATNSWYDSSLLDTYVEQQASNYSLREPQPEELVKTQIWAHIDPREKWSKRYSKDWLAEKRSEIQSRGGRKANMGKLLTSKVRKERLLNNWNIHQSKAVVADIEGSKSLEELFMVKNIDNMVPGLRNERIVMMEKEREIIDNDEGGRKKRRAALQCYPLR